MHAKHDSIFFEKNLWRKNAIKVRKMTFFPRAKQGLRKKAVKGIIHIILYHKSIQKITT